MKMVNAMGEKTNADFSGQNRFYIPTDKEKYSSRDILFYKTGNRFVTFILSRLVDFNGDIKAFKLEHKKQYFTIVQARLESTIINENGCTDKLGVLVLYLERNPEKVEAFLKSPLITQFILPLRSGSTQIGLDGTYINGWKSCMGSEPLTESQALERAMSCYVESPECDIEINLAAVMDTIVKRGLNGEYFFDFTNDNVKINRELSDAAQCMINVIKESSEFKKKYNQQ